MSEQIRLMTSADIPAAMRLKDEAGWNQTVLDWRRFLSASPDGCFAVDVDGQVIGTAATIVYEYRFAWIGMIVVEPRYRGRGLAISLLETTMEHLEGRGVPCMKLDATPEGRPLYTKLGFVSEYEIERWMLTRSEAPTHAAPRSEEWDEQRSDQGLDEMFALDREIFGADRNRILRSLDEEAPEFTLIARDQGEIGGYALGRRGSRADHLGPWMARTEAIASRLLDEFLRRSQRDLVFVDVLRANPVATPLLAARGFEISRPLTRMLRGANAHPGRPDLLCAILGPEFG